MNHLEKINCFECSGKNSDCEYYGRYIEGSGKKCIYKEIALDDMHKYNSNKEGIELKDMLNEYLARCRLQEFEEHDR